MKPKFLTVAQMIEELEKYDGDLPVAIDGVSDWIVDKIPFYYDGGFLAPSEESHNNYLSSKVGSPTGTKKGEGFPNTFLRITSGDPNMSKNNKINGRSIREIDPDGWDFLEIEEMKERNIFDGEIVRYIGSKTKDEKLGCYPMKAYLDSGMEAIGTGNMSSARETLTDKFQTLKGLNLGTIDPGNALLSDKKGVREAANIFLENKNV